jgi:hypothetical protein
VQGGQCQGLLCFPPPHTCLLQAAPPPTATPLLHASPIYPLQHPQTKAKPPQAAGPSSPQKPPTPELTKAASPGPQEDTDIEDEPSGQSLREEGGV